MEADWKGKELFFLEATHTAIPACVARTGGAKPSLQRGHGFGRRAYAQDGRCGWQPASDLIKAALTAHPKAVFGMIPCWDQLGVDPWNVAKEAGRGGDVMLVTLGGDKPYADLLVPSRKTTTAMSSSSRTAKVGAGPKPPWRSSKASFRPLRAPHRHHPGDHRSPLCRVVRGFAYPGSQTVIPPSLGYGGQDRPPYPSLSPSQPLSPF